MTGTFSFRTGCVTYVGLARELNEDNALVRSDVGLWARPWKNAFAEDGGRTSIVRL